MIRCCRPHAAIAYRAGSVGRGRGVSVRAGLGVAAEHEHPRVLGCAAVVGAPVAAAARLHLQRSAREVPIVTTSAELAGLLGCRGRGKTLPGVPGGVSRTCPRRRPCPLRGW